MNATALICDANQHFSLQDVVLQDPAADQITIRTAFSGVSIGTEFALIRNKISWGPYPLCTGYMGTGVVEAVGRNVSQLKEGDRVYFRGNAAMELKDGSKVSSVSGTHCSHVVTTVGTSHGAAALPEGAALDVASMFVLPAVGLYGVDMAGPRLGETVVVHGSGLIGLGVVAACAHRGCVVIAVDMQEKQLAMARAMGADHVINARTQEVAAEVKKLVPDGADFVFECTGLPACVEPAMTLCRTLGTFVWQGNYGGAPLPFHFLPPHGRRLRMFFPCDDGLQPCRRAVIRNMVMGALKWEKCITHRITGAEAPAMFDRINRGKAPDALGIVISWQN